MCMHIFSVDEAFVIIAFELFLSIVLYLVNFLWNLHIVHGILHGWDDAPFEVEGP